MKIPDGTTCRRCGTDQVAEHCRNPRCNWAKCVLCGVLTVLARRGGDK